MNVDTFRLPRYGFIRLIILIAFLLAVNVPAQLSSVQFAGFGVVVLLCWAVGNVGLRRILRRFALIAPFTAVIIIAIPFRPGTPLYTLELGFMSIVVTEEGLRVLFTVLEKAALSLFAAVVLLSDVPFTELLYGLQKLKIPKMLLTVLSFAYRFLFTARDEARRTERAWAARYYGKRKLAQLATMGKVVGLLLLRGFDRSERVYNAMLSRGYDGEIRALDKSKGGFAAYFYLIATLSSIAAVYAVHYLWIIFYP